MKMRLDRYCRATSTLGLDSIMLMDGCKGLNESFTECLSDGTCPHCSQFADQIGPLVLSEHEVDKTSDIIDQLSDSTTTVTTVAAVISSTKSASTSTEATRLSTTTEGPKTTTTKESSCPEGLYPAEGLDGCCLPEVAYLGDGACDPDAPYNTPECNFDNGDCCQETCNFDTNYGCSNEASQGYGPFGYFCLNPDLDEYIDPEECTVPDRTRLGDGRCDPDYNTAECNWDGGDCCEESCDPRYAYFECGDAAFPYECKAEVKGGSSTTAIPSETSTTTSAFSTADSSTSTTTVYQPEEPASKVTVVSSQMATIFKNDPDTPHGGDILQVKGTSFGPDAQDILMRFFIPASELDPINATLRVYAMSDSSSGGIFHIAPESSPWSEETVTWNNADDYTSRLGALNDIKANKWYTIDVTGEVEKLDRSSGHITVRIRSRNPDTADYGSHQQGHPPELEIMYRIKDTEELSKEPTEDPAVQTSNADGFVDIPTQPKDDYTTSTIVTVEAKEFYIGVDEYSSSGDGSHYYPIWDTNGSFCAKGEPPSWASGPYLKKTKKQCCDSYFMLKRNECMNS